MKNRKGGLLYFKSKKSDYLVHENIIFIILNLLFCIALLFFVYRSANGASVLEQAYAEQAALLIDMAKPDMSIIINIEDALKIAEKSRLDKGKIFTIDKTEKRVILKLAERGSYSYQYFNDAEISYSIDDVFLRIDIKNKEVKNA